MAFLDAQWQSYIYWWIKVVDTDLVNDTSPQLGGNLDINGNGIVSTSNANIAIAPNGTGQVMLDGNVGIESGLIDLKNSGFKITNNSSIVSQRVLTCSNITSRRTRSSS